MIAECLDVAVEKAPESLFLTAILVRLWVSSL